MVVLKIVNALIQAAKLSHLQLYMYMICTCNDSFKLSEISDYPRLLVTYTSLTVCLLCIYLAHGRQTFIAVINNMRTLKFKAQLRIGFFTAVNHNYGRSQRILNHRNKQNGSKSTNRDRETWPFDTAEVNL